MPNNIGAFGENFPYTNQHDMNMDWIIKIAKDFLDQYTTLQQTITDGMEGLENKATELENLLQEWYDTHSEDIANQLESALEDLNEWYTTHQNYLDQTLTLKIAEFNTRAEQKAVETIATIPSDYTALANEVSGVSESLDKSNESIELVANYPVVFDWNWVEGEYVITNTGAFAEYAGWRRSEYVPLNGVKALAVETNASVSFRNNAFYDANHNYIVDFNISNPLIIVPANAVYFVVSHSDTTTIKITNADYPSFDEYTKTGILSHFNNSEVVDKVNVFYCPYTAQETSVYRKIKDLSLNTNETYTMTIESYENIVNNALVIIYFYDANNNTIASYEISKTQPLFTFTTPRNFVSCDMWVAPIGSTASGIANNAKYNGITILRGKNTLINNYVSPYSELPYYFDYTVNAKLENILSRLAENGDCMAVITDYHVGYNANHSPLIINWLYENTPIKKLFNLGDTINQAIDANTMVKELSKFRTLFRTDEYFATCGNHEWYTNLINEQNPIPTEGQLYNAIVKEQENNIKGKTVNCSYYFDNDIQKIRYIVLGCNYNSDLTPTQVNWAVNIINNTPTDYTLVIFSHTGLTFADSIPIGSFTNIINALDSFNGKVAGVFVGHQHKEGQYTTPSGIRFIQLNCDSYDLQEGEIVRRLGNYTEQSFYIIQINTQTSTVNIENIGAGNSTSYTY